MSFEGYYQSLCEKGHQRARDCMYDELAECHCGAKIVWTNLVDITNGSHSDDGTRIDGYVELKSKDIKKCEHCGSILEQTYELI